MNKKQKYKSRKYNMTNISRKRRQPIPVSRETVSIISWRILPQRNQVSGKNYQ